MPEAKANPIEAVATTAEVPAEPKPEAQRLEDAGEKIGGARKDL